MVDDEVKIGGQRSTRPDLQRQFHLGSILRRREIRGREIFLASLAYLSLSFLFFLSRSLG